MKKGWLYGITSIIVSFLLISCLDNFNREVDTVNYNPSYSVPVGPLDYSVVDIMPPNALDFEILDTSQISDTIPLLIYDDVQFFINPEFGYQTSFIEPIDLSQLSLLSEYIVSLMFRVNITNNMPTSLSTQVYFLSPSNEIVDSLYQEGRVEIESPEIDQNGYVVAPFQTTIDTYLENTDFEALLQITSIEIYVYLHTNRIGHEILYVYSWHGMSLQIGVRAELSVPI